MTAATLGIDHIGLTVANLEASTRFFTECLGWRIFGSNPAYPAAYVTDGTAKITLWQVADTTAFAPFDRKKTVGLHHLALKVPDRSSLDSLSNGSALIPVFRSSLRRSCLATVPSGMRW